MKISSNKILHFIQSMSHLLSHSFATKLSIYVLSFTLAVFVCIMALFYNYSQRKITDDAIELAHGSLQHLATQISGELQRVEAAVRQSVWIVEKNLDKPDSLRYIISSVVNSNELIVGSGIAFVPDYYKQKGKYFMPYASMDNDSTNTHYQVLGSTDYDYPCMDWFLIPRLLKKSYWSEPYYDTGGGNTIMSTFALPLCDKQGEVYAIFTANISLTQFTDMVNQLKPYTSSFTFLLSRNGSYLTHPKLEKIMNETIFSDAFSANDTLKGKVGYEMVAGHTGTIKYNYHKQDDYAFYTSIPQSGWSVCTVCSSQVILSHLDTFSHRIIYMFVIGMLILLPVIFCIIHRLVRPLKEFSKSARSIATGRFDVKLPAVRTNNEIKDLRDSLSYMQRSLSTYVSELQSTTAAKERIESELSIAHDIQMGMIPKTFPPYPDRNDIDLHAILNPAKEVGGDFYDFFIDGDRLYFVIGDVSGKSVSASLFMAIARSLFRTLAQQAESPARIMSQMNRSISENNESSMFITLIIGILDLKTGHLRFCNAGHNPPVMITPNGIPAFLKAKIQLFVGVLEEMEYTDEEITLEKDSRLFLYTDGITEAENADKALYGEERLLQTLAEAGTGEAHAIVDAVVQSVADHVREAEASDDMTILVLHYKPEKQ